MTDTPVAPDDGALRERVVAFASPQHHFTLLVAPDGRFVASGGGSIPVELTRDGSDAAMWEREADGRFRHPVTGVVLSGSPTGSSTVTTRTDGRAPDASGATVALSLDGRALGEAGEIDGVDPLDGGPGRFRIAHGPELLPSAYLAHMEAHGWVCLTSVLAPELVEDLERLACTDRYADRTPDRGTPPIAQGPALARTAAEPASLWVTRHYLQTDEVRIGHPPGLAVLTPDDGERAVQGWHSDYPYHWGVPARGRVPTPTGRTVLGVQRNVCVSSFTREGGATAFKLGSHARDEGPPEAWGTAGAHARPGYRAAHGLPYHGPDADVIEAPGGSIILYDARTWHRAGINRTDRRRAAVLQAMLPPYILPKNDTGGAFRDLRRSSAWSALDCREQADVTELLVHRFAGPGGRFPIGGHRGLSELVGIDD